jgi:hypothetical protein
MCTLEGFLAKLHGVTGVFKPPAAAQPQSMISMSKDNP